jgi:hypothetical protein
MFRIGHVLTWKHACEGWRTRVDLRRPALRRPLYEASIPIAFTCGEMSSVHYVLSAMYTGDPVVIRITDRQGLDTHNQTPVVVLYHMRHEGLPSFLFVMSYQIAAVNTTNLLSDTINHNRHWSGKFKLLCVVKQIYTETYICNICPELLAQTGPNWTMQRDYNR